MVRVDLPADFIKSKNFRMPNGKENGANPNWRPGGYTYNPKTGVSVAEAVIDNPLWSEIPDSWRKEF